MPVHDALYAGGCLRSISSVSPWYPLVGIPIGVHGPHSARLGHHPSRLKIGTLARPLPAFNCSEEVFAMDILAESRPTFRQGHTVQPFAMVSGKQCVVTKLRRVERKPNSWPLRVSKLRQTLLRVADPSLLLVAWRSIISFCNIIYNNNEMHDMSGRVGAVYPNWDAYQMNGYHGDTDEMLRRQPPTYSVQASCTDILLSSLYDRLQPSNMILLFRSPPPIELSDHPARPRCTTSHSSLISSSVSS